MNTNSPIHIQPFRRGDEEAIVELWTRCGLVHPANDPRKDIQRKLNVQPDTFLIALLDGKIVGSVMAGYEGHRGWINYLAVAPEAQRRGIGRLLMISAEALLKDAGCPKINLQVRTSNSQVIAFYKAIGFTVDDVVSLGKRLENDLPNGGK